MSDETTPQDSAAMPPASDGSAKSERADAMAEFCVRARAWRDERGFPSAGEMLDEAVEIIERASERIAALRTCEAWLQKQVAERDETIAELRVALSRGWQWTDESLPGLDGRLLISVGGSCREGFYKDGKFTDKYGEQKPVAWMSLPMAPRYRNGQYVWY